MDVKPSLIVLVNEIEVMNSLSEDSIRLIHATKQIQAMKKVIQMQEIVQLNLNIQRDFAGTEDIIWDVGALAALKQYRQEMIVYHSRDFDPEAVLRRFVEKIQQLILTVQHRMQITL
jgi:hypothetical protein